MLTSVHGTQGGQDMLAFLQPWLLKRLLNFVGSYNSPEGEPAFHGYIIALGMFCCAITQTVSLSAESLWAGDG